MTSYDVGLTGGTGAGKSTAAARFGELGAVVVDADVLAREAVAPGTPGLAAVVAAFGPGVLAADGSLDRPALGRVVFGDAELRATLEGIVHPRVAARRAELAAAARAADPDAVVVHDVPLLVERGLTGGLDLVVVVDAPDELRVQRLVEGRGLAREDALARVAAQASRDERLAAADVVLDGTGSVADLRRQVDALWERLAEAVAASRR
ncbi:dephospho-CoA kinase [Motilibacter rhizosphaerae]|uniref:Dephospho-CoA kinase n=1 Tax=Motilibacter rhizosphaerae TaxID=598652 RepID=A0A4Q7NHB9_9ACTN|nr:dephospho-CoA kinase [Motilibacter rhizosphaerae]RZS82846.1 dephospho-CoA kinase [Motilibacter rhizosphaerae]